MVLMSSGSGRSLEGTPPTPRLEFQKRSKVNLPQALTEEKPERQVGEGQRSSSFCPKNCQELSCKEAAREEEVQGLRVGEASRRAFLSEVCFRSPSSPDPSPQSRLGGL